MKALKGMTGLASKRHYIASRNSPIASPIV